MPYKIPLRPYPNQTFYTTIPINDRNVDLTITLNYNDVAKYWSMTVVDTVEDKVLFSQLPLLTSFMDFSNILCQLGYKAIGSAYVFPTNFTVASRPNDIDLGKNYQLIWGDNLP